MFYDTRKKNDHGLPYDPFKAIDLAGRGLA